MTEELADTATRDKPLDALRLALVSGIGPRLRKALLERFETAEGVFAAAPSDLRSVPGIGAELARRIVLAPQEIDAQEQLDACHRDGVTIVALEDPIYPRALREIYDPPGILFVKGRLDQRDALSIAIVGSRHATRYGIEQAERLASSLARAGLTIVSGLARGIDAAAHRGALAAGGRTLAVLGSGVLNVYPPEHAALAEEVMQSGAMLSEAPPHSPPQSGAFPQRNRIITGIALGVIVVEASAQSGALISARHAMEQGREVFAVPGRIDSRMSRGCHQLIRDGAKLVETPDDVLEELGPLVAPAERDDHTTIHHPAELLLNDVEKRVLDAIASEPTSIDQVVAAAALPVGQVLSTLSVLEMRHLVRRASANVVMRP